MKKREPIQTLLVGIAIGVAVTLGAIRIIPVMQDYFDPPRVTLMNASGEEMTSIVISLGQAKQEIPILKDHHAITVPIGGGFSECSTHVEWSDTKGRHSESAGDYMESYGFYHARIVITPDRKAKAIYNITKSNKEIHRTQ
jgi:hypothetical protein